MWYSGARKRPATNVSGAMQSHLGLILHVQEGNGDLGAQFSDRKSQSSYTWVVAKDGGVDQFVDSDLTAWAHGSGNGSYNSVGTQGFATEPLTQAACQTIAALYRWGNAQYGWPFQLAESPGERGFGWHGMGGSDWGGHPGCPGDLRKNQRQQILSLAAGQPLPERDPVSSAPPFPGRLLRLAQPFLSGEDVRTWQAQMGNRGWTIDTDGVFGPQADDICRRFQAEKGLGVDGVVGADTWRAAWESPVTGG